MPGAVIKFEKNLNREYEFNSLLQEIVVAENWRTWPSWKQIKLGIIDYIIFNAAAVMPTFILWNFGNEIR